MYTTCRNTWGSIHNNNFNKQCLISYYFGLISSIYWITEITYRHALYYIFAGNTVRLATNAVLSWRKLLARVNCSNRFTICVVTWISFLNISKLNFALTSKVTVFVIVYLQKLNIKLIENNKFKSIFVNKSVKKKKSKLCMH